MNAIGTKLRAVRISHDTHRIEAFFPYDGFKRPTALGELIQAANGEFIVEAAYIGNPITRRTASAEAALAFIRHEVDELDNEPAEPHIEDEDGEIAFERNMSAWASQWTDLDAQHGM